MKNFALIGVAGFVAPKHLNAIKETGHRLIVAHDKHDSVGIMDSYFPHASFFTEYERFDRFLEKQRQEKDGMPVEFLTICTPNYLHDAHCRLALRLGADAICEKPLVINPWNLDQLSELEQIHGRKIYNVLQLRLHESIISLKNEIEETPPSEKPEICLTYITRRGRWYNYSWKGKPEQSGGLPLNIGVHFFDFLAWVYGKPQSYELHLAEENRWGGYLELEKANVKWFLSVDESDLPTRVVEQGGYAYRSITKNGVEIELSKGFTDLHTRVYQDILEGGGFGVEDARQAIEIVHHFRNMQVVTPKRKAHPVLIHNSTSIHQHV